MLRSASLASAFFITVLFASRGARADDSAAAGELFEQAKALMAEGKTAEACAKFQASLDLDAALGTKLNLADCYEKIGRVGSAYKLFVDAEKSATASGDDRAPFAAARRDALQPRAPRLFVDVVQGPEDVTVLLQGKLLPKGEYGIAQIVDPGDIEVAVLRADREKLESKTVALAESKEEHVALDLDAIDKAHPRKTKMVLIEPDPAQKIAGFVIGGVGVAGLAAFTALEVPALVIRSDADSEGLCVNDVCSPDGIAMVEQSGTLAEVGQWVGVGGVACAAIGLTLLLTAPSAEEVPEENAPQVGVAPFGPGDGPGITFGGRF
jgi:tetratricopeptide (TPR) repeat protein